MTTDPQDVMRQSFEALWELDWGRKPERDESGKYLPIRGEDDWEQFQAGAAYATQNSAELVGALEKYATAGFDDNGRAARKALERSPHPSARWHKVPDRVPKVLKLL